MSLRSQGFGNGRRSMSQRLSDKDLMWKKRNMKFLMVLGPVMVIAFCFFSIFTQHEINRKAIVEGRPIGFQFSFIFPIIMGLSFWITALLVKCQILEDRIAALEENNH